jgi:hypothetical protein
MRDGDGSIPACTSYECKKDTATAGWDVPEEFSYGDSYGRRPDYVIPTMLHQKDSIPACTSVDCKKDSVADSYEVPTIAPEVLGANTTYKKLNQRQSTPACGSTGCYTKSVADTWDLPSVYTDRRGDPEHTYGTGYEAHVTGLTQRRSVPACDSTGCKTASVNDSTDAPSLYTDVRGDPNHTYGTGYSTHVYGLNQERSVPACDSTGCKKGSVADSYDVPSLYTDVRGDPDHTYGTGYSKPHVFGLYQRQSVPACDSTGCKKGSVIDSYDVPSLNPDLRQGTAYTYGNSGLF